MRSKSLAAMGLALVLVTGLLFAQGPNKNVGAKVPLPDVPDKNGKAQAPSLSIDVDVVTLDVVVTDKNGNPVTGLEKRNFKLYDNDVEQTITNFSPSEAPLTVVVVLEFGQTFGYYFDDVVGPAAGFINSLRENDWAALVAYDIRPEILTDFTKNKGTLFDGLRRLQIPTYRETALYDAVYDTLERLDEVDGKKAIFLLSTGLDTISKH